VATDSAAISHIVQPPSRIRPIGGSAARLDPRSDMTQLRFGAGLAENLRGASGTLAFQVALGFSTKFVK